MKFSCVTPCLNAEKYIEETMISVLTQSVFHSSEFSLDYVVQDGGSTDGTAEIVRKLVDKFSAKDNIEVRFVSESDTGMYDALCRGFQQLNGGDIYSYLNAGDFYAPHAFSIVAGIFSKNSVSFLTGFNTIYNDSSHIVASNLPFDYSKNLLLKGFYGSLLPHVQQESTFWKSNLQEKIDLSELGKYRLAGDYYMWVTFIQEAPLFIVGAWLGGYKRHHGQLSSMFGKEYEAEMSGLAEKRSFADYLTAYVYKVASYLPVVMKKWLSKKTFSYDHNGGGYRLN